MKLIESITGGDSGASWASRFPCSAVGRIVNGHRFDSLITLAGVLGGLFRHASSPYSALDASALTRTHA